jgi:hypothetical protein
MVGNKKLLILNQGAVLGFLDLLCPPLGMANREIRHPHWRKALNREEK